MAIISYKLLLQQTVFHFPTPTCMKCTENSVEPIFSNFTLVQGFMSVCGETSVQTKVPSCALEFSENVLINGGGAPQKQVYTQGRSASAVLAIDPQQNNKTMLGCSCCAQFNIWCHSRPVWTGAEQWNTEEEKRWCNTACSGIWEAKVKMKERSLIQQNK